MIKVCHMTSVHPAEDVRIFHKECVSLAKAGYEVYLVERGDSYDKNGVHIIGVGNIPSNRLKRMIYGGRSVYKAALKLDCDVYHFHDPELLPYGLKLKRKGKKVIFDSHEHYSTLIKQKNYLPKCCMKLIGKVYTQYEKYVLKRIDAVVFPCLKDGKHPYEGMCPKTCAVNNSALLDELYDKYNPKIKKNIKSVVYIGELSYSRGISHLIQAARKSEAIVYLGGKSFSKEYQKMIETASDGKTIKYFGVLNRQEVCELLLHCQVGMANILNVGQYNQYDNLATKVYEYMALGLPVVLTHSTYNDKIMEQYQFGICVDPTNVDEIANAIRYLLDNPEEARRMGENGRRAVEQEFNWGVEEKKLLELYEELEKQ